MIENRNVITNKIDHKGQRLTSYTKQKAALNSYNTHRGADMSLPNLNMRSLKYVQKTKQMRNNEKKENQDVTNIPVNAATIAGMAGIINVRPI